MTSDSVTPDGTWSYSYDDAGEMIGKSRAGESWSYAYDHRGQLVAATRGDGASVAYAYDAFGNRLARTETDGGGRVVSDERFAYDGWDPAKGDAVGTEHFDAVAGLDASGQVVERRAFGSGTDDPAVRVDRDGTGSWYLADRQGSVRLVTDAGGSQATGSRSYGAYGGVAAASGGGLDRYGYAGREADPLTGQEYGRARYREGARFTTQDTIGLAGGDANLYRYVGNDPANNTDPSGLQPPSAYPPGADRGVPPRPGAGDRNLRAGLGRPGEAEGRRLVLPGAGGGPANLGQLSGERMEFVLRNSGKDGPFYVDGNGDIYLRGGVTRKQEQELLGELSAVQPKHGSEQARREQETRRRGDDRIKEETERRRRERAEQDSEDLLDGIQFGLGTAGLIPVVGELFDLADGLVSLARGDCVGAGLSLAAAVPFFGTPAGLAKLGRKIGKLEESLRAARKSGNAKEADRLAAQLGALKSQKAELEGAAAGARANGGVTVGGQPVAPRGYEGRGAEPGGRGPGRLGETTPKAPVTPTPLPKNPTIHPGQQDKHIPGRNNFEQAVKRGETPSELTHPNPQKLLDDFTGKGTLRGSAESGWRETVDFGQIIGKWRDPATGASLPTTRGTIMYKPNGQAHIVPSNPNPLK